MGEPTTDSRECLVVVCPCGGIGLAMSPDLLADPAEAADLSEMVRLGGRATTMPVEAVHKSRWCFDESCPARRANGKQTPDA